MVKEIIAVREGFNLEKAVCNHGFFMMAPNNWESSTKTLKRPLRLSDHDRTTVIAFIHQPINESFITVDYDHHLKSQLELSCHQRQFLRCQVVRMLRLSAEDDTIINEFHKLNYAAKKIGFGHIFRSPTLFEDMVKSILLCNCSGNFPNPKEIASLDVETLREYNLGYRAETILELANKIANGSLKLDDFSTPTTLYHRLMKIKGFGCFVVANVMMCLGFYQYIPIDTETIKHLEQVHKKTNLKTQKARNRVIAQIYDKFAPYQCLVYWMERVEVYEKQLGKLSELPSTRYANATSPTKKDVQN